MPIGYFGHLIATERSARANLQLGICLAFIAGALNAGGFLAIGQYTSHMTGIVSALADDIVLGNLALAVGGLLSLLAFVSGAASTALLVNHARRNGIANIYATPLIIEALLLLAFGILGATFRLEALVNVSVTAILLCYVMGLQNALVTKISNAEIRTTHITGLVTDVGIELGKLLYWNRNGTRNYPPVLANRRRLMVHASLIASFFIGGVIGALGFKHVGFSSTVPLAVVLILISIAPVFRK